MDGLGTPRGRDTADPQLLAGGAQGGAEGAARAQDAAPGRSMLIPLSALQSRNRPAARGKSGWLRVQLSLEEVQQGMLTFHSGQGAAGEGRVLSLVVMVCARPQNLTSREKKK